MSRDGPLWVAWPEPAETRTGGCCWESPGCEGCRLEPAPAGSAARPALARTSPLPLEGDRELLMLVRIDAHRIERLRTVGVSCPLDAGGLPFVTLTGVSPAQSLAWLRTLVDRSEPARAAPHLRVGDSGDLAARRSRRRCPCCSIWRAATPSRVCVDRRSSRSPRRRDDGSRPEIAGFVDSDPDTEVKKRAVFAVSQLPKDEGVPLLIKIARDHTNQAVRRQAMFWLGQSKDPRAIDFFASVLK